jgi:hypothetical protein
VVPPGRPRWPTQEMPGSAALLRSFACGLAGPGRGRGAGGAGTGKLGRHSCTVSLLPCRQTPWDYCWGERQEVGRSACAQGHEAQALAAHPHPNAGTARMLACQQ